jgi:hypothetical protein
MHIRPACTRALHAIGLSSSTQLAFSLPLGATFVAETHQFLVMLTSFSRWLPTAVIISSFSRSDTPYIPPYCIVCAKILLCLFPQ